MCQPMMMRVQPQSDRTSDAMPCHAITADRQTPPGSGPVIPRQRQARVRAREANVGNERLMLLDLFIVFFS